MRFAASLIFALYTSTAFAQLPPPTEEERAKSAEIAAKNAWTTKVGTYRLCLEMDRTAAKYHARLKASGKDVPQPTITAPCTDPGPYVSLITAAAPQPREAAEAHSPAGTAVSPPNTKAKAEETRGSSSK
ncbi:MAG: formate dehydrogenase [Methylophilaceae bacterium]